ncbi:cofactor assembly of complex C subunit B [Pseudanabaena sp. FACHB-2040]|uniref:cofactor assembly of complex C subunit B n=1 Tax=Pseudanabaena sp. FACHB-2040 TaxID=2692859 RepID=UPI00168A0975|nr:cofactor assembly of complex C subunit B [Cyanobacteria bacterium Co-bin8]MBD2259884.1 cofactor assembly of complex C subunit B [Pseudanabaena sp. FACHB-2040]
MTNTVLSSTFLLTLLLMVGLFFFIRAATKDRTETLQVTVAKTPETLQSDLQTYFESRAYQVADSNLAAHQITFKGFVRPSLFLAIFLSSMAAIGASCLALVLAILLPDYGSLFSVLLLAAPGAGLFYWRRAGREEQVLMKVEPEALDAASHSKMTVVAHRDELAALKQALSL